MSSEFADYLSRGQLYFNNAQIMMGEGNYSKASEMIWGAVTQTIKAVAVLSSKPISHHNMYRPFLLFLSKKFNDQEILMLFDLIEKLHVNFYED